MNNIELLAFIILPISIGALAWLIALINDYYHHKRIILMSFKCLTKWSQGKDIEKIQVNFGNINYVEAWEGEGSIITFRDGTKLYVKEKLSLEWPCGCKPLLYMEEGSQ